MPGSLKHLGRLLGLGFGADMFARLRLAERRADAFTVILTVFAMSRVSGESPCDVEQSCNLVPLTF